MCSNSYNSSLFGFALQIFALILVVWCYNLAMMKLSKKYEGDELVKEK